MEALAIDRFGTCGIINAPQPRPKKGQLLIEVRAASFNRGDYAFRKNLHIANSSDSLASPRTIIGADVAGTVMMAASDVTGFKPGDRVCAVCPGLSGAMAQYAVADAKWAAHIPDGMPFEQAAAIPSSGVTALTTVEKAEANPGRSILVCGASGGVGQYATLLASDAGARVDAACGAANLDAAYGCGASEAFDYAQGLSNVPSGRYDAAIGVNGRFPAGELTRILKPGGTYVVVGQDSLRPSALALPLRGKKLRVGLFFAEIGRGGLAKAVEAVASSPHSIRIESCQGLDYAPAMLASMVSSHPKGKHIVIL